MSVHSFASTVLVSPDVFILTHFTDRGWTPVPQEVEHYKQGVKKNSVSLSDFFITALKLKPTI